MRGENGTKAGEKEAETDDGICFFAFLMTSSHAFVYAIFICLLHI
jgi:hypothetical protein